MNGDLTVGEPIKVLPKYWLGLLGSVVFQQIYNIADSLIAGKFVGGNALAAVGNAYEVTLIYLSFATGCNIGCSVIIAMLFGAKRYKNLKTGVSTAFIASGILCALLMLSGFLFVPTLLKMINTPPEIMSDTILYLNIYTGGLIFLFFYNISNGIFSALGDSRTPFIFLAVSSLSNIAVDIWFVTQFKMGVAGVAWATFICQGVSCILSMITVFIKLSKIKCEEKSPLFSFDIFKKMTKIAVPSTIQQCFISVGNIMIQGMVNSFGSTVIQGYSAAIKLNNFMLVSVASFGNAISNYTGQNIGAGKYDRVKKGVKTAVIIGLCLTAAVSAIYVVFRKQLIGLFMDGSNIEALKVGMTYLMIVSPFGFILIFKQVSDGVLRGAGVIWCYMIATFTDLILRVVIAHFLSNMYGSIGIWLAWPIGWILGTGISFSFYKSGIWQKQKFIS